MLAFPEYSQARPHGWWRTVTLRWLEYFYSSQWEKIKHLLSPLRSSCTAQAAGEPAGEDPPHCSTHRGSHSFCWRAGAWDSLSPLRRDGGQPFPTQQGLGTAFPHSAGAGDSPPSFSLTPPCLDLPKAPRSFLWSQNKARVAGPLGGRGRRAPGPSATCRIGGFLSRQ